MPLGTLGTPAVGFAAASVDLSERTSEQRLDLEELVKQIVAPLSQLSDLLLEKRA